MQQKEIFLASGPTALSVRPRSADASPIFHLRAETHPIVLLAESEKTDNKQNPNSPKCKYVILASKAKCSTTFSN
jgi:hypothetical protein